MKSNIKNLVLILFSLNNNFNGRNLYNYQWVQQGIMEQRQENHLQELNARQMRILNRYQEPIGMMLWQKVVGFISIICLLSMFLYANNKKITQIMDGYNFIII